MIDFRYVALLLFAMTKQVLHQKTVLTAHPALNGLSLKSVELIPTCPSYLSFSLCPSERLSLTPKLKQQFNYSLYMTRPKSSATYSFLSEFGLSLSPLYLQYLESFLVCCSNSVNICWMNKWTVIFPLWPRVHSCSLKLLRDHLRRLMHSGRKRGERSACSHHGLQ